MNQHISMRVVTLGIFLVPLFVIGAVSPRFEYRGKIPGDVLDLSNTVEFVTSITNRIAILESYDPGTITGVVRAVNGNYPDNVGNVNVDVGVKTINGVMPVDGNINIPTESFTNALFVMRHSQEVMRPQTIYSVNVETDSVLFVVAPTNGIQGISSTFSIMVNAAQRVKVIPVGFVMESLWVPVHWDGYIDAGKTEIIFTEYAPSRYAVQMKKYISYSDYDKRKPLRFIAASELSTLSMSGSGVKLEYSKDNISWNAFIPSQTIITFDAPGDILYIRAADTGNAGMNGCRFRMEGKLYCQGNIMYLLDQTASSMSISTPSAFAQLFADCHGHLLSAPELPATNLSEACYFEMFKGCSSLTVAPLLPAKTLAKSCYELMFSECSELVDVPDIGATLLTEKSMRLTFLMCEKLKSIKVHFTVWDMKSTEEWVRGVQQNSTCVFTCPMELPHGISDYGISKIPAGWTVTSEAD